MALNSFGAVTEFGLGSAFLIRLKKNLCKAETQIFPGACHQNQNNIHEVTHPFSPDSCFGTALAHPGVFWSKRDISFH